MNCNIRFIARHILGGQQMCYCKEDIPHLVDAFPFGFQRVNSVRDPIHSLLMFVGKPLQRFHFFPVCRICRLHSPFRSNFASCTVCASNSFFCWSSKRRSFIMSWTPFPSGSGFNIQNQQNSSSTHFLGLQVYIKDIMLYNQ